MSTPIKPPGSTPFSKPPEPVADVTGTEKPAETFREVLDELASVDAVSNANDTSLDSVQAIADQLRIGEIDTPTALEKLLENALQDLAVSALSPEERLEIEKLLRNALQDDPTLAALTRDLQRQEPVEK